MKITFGSSIPLKLIGLFVLLGPIAIFAKKFMSSYAAENAFGCLLFVILEALLFWSVFREMRSKS